MRRRRIEHRQGSAPPLPEEIAKAVEACRGCGNGAAREVALRELRGVVLRRFERSAQDDREAAYRAPWLTPSLQSLARRRDRLAQDVREFTERRTVEADERALTDLARALHEFVRRETEIHDEAHRGPSSFTAGAW